MHEILGLIIFWTVLCLNRFNPACSLTYLFNYAFKHCCEVWVYSLPFFTVFTVQFLLMKLAFIDAHQQCLLGLSQSSASVRGVRARPKAGFMFNVQKQPVLVSDGASLAKKLHLDTKTESHQGGRKSARSVSTSSIYPKKKGSHRRQLS